MKKQSRVQWSDQEWDDLADATWRLRIENPEETLLWCVHEAQKFVFSPDRRRRLNSVTRTPMLMDRIIERSNDQVAKNNKTESITKPLSDQEIFSKYSKTIFEMMSIDDVLKNFSPEDIVEEVETAKLVGVAARKLTESLTHNSGALVDLMMESLAQQPPKVITEKYTAKKRLPRVAVLGLKKEQFNILRNKLSSTVEIEFVEKNGKLNLPTGCDYYLIWTRFVSHSVHGQVNNVAKPNQIILHRGGIEKMVEEIKQRLEAR